MARYHQDGDKDGIIYIQPGDSLGTLTASLALPSGLGSTSLSVREDGSATYEHVVHAVLGPGEAVDEAGLNVRNAGTDQVALDVRVVERDVEDDGNVEASGSGYPHHADVSVTVSKSGPGGAIERSSGMTPPPVALTEADQVIFPIERDQPGSVPLTPSSPASQETAVNAETGEINWDCPCLKDAIAPPCGDYFKAAFSCFVQSETVPRGEDCLDAFMAMHQCYQAHPEIYRPKDEYPEQGDEREEKS
jgi:hypothetical protein